MEGQSISMKMHSPGHSSADSMVASSWPAGTVLHYMCVFHPWMQGVINVT